MKPDFDTTMSQQAAAAARIWHAHYRSRTDPQYEHYLANNRAVTLYLLSTRRVGLLRVVSQLRREHPFLCAVFLVGLLTAAMLFFQFFHNPVFAPLGSSWLGLKFSL